MATNLFVGKLSYGTTDSQLGEYFSQSGTVISAKVIMDKYTGQSRGFGFVEMATEKEAKRAIDQLNNSSLDGRSLFVGEAKPRENHNTGH